MPPDHITYFAETDSRGKHVRFGIKRSDRQYHTAIVGRTGMGKSTLMETLMAADIRAGFGFALLVRGRALTKRGRWQLAVRKARHSYGRWRRTVP